MLDILVERASALKKMLSDEDFGIIQKEYPFKKLRDKKIVELSMKGASNSAISVLSGLSNQRISEIVHGKSKKNTSHCGRGKR